jgi:hypothetical protein
MAKRGHQPRGLLVSDHGIFLVTVSAPSAVQGATVSIFAQFATSSGSPVAEPGRVVTWGKTGNGGSFNTASSTTNSAGVASVQLTVGTVIGGTYTVTASGTQGVTGISPTITVTADLVPTSVSVTPTTLSLEVGSTGQLAAVVKNALGTVLTGQVVTWASLTPGIATVNGSGLVTAVATGLTTVDARINGISSNAVTTTVTVDSVPASIVIPATLTINTGTSQLSATVKNAAGAVIPGLVPTAWNSSAPTKVTVINTGLVT